MKIKPLLEGFDFAVLNDPNFKEDSVREDILMPILSYLGVPHPIVWTQV